MSIFIVEISLNVDGKEEDSAHYYYYGADFLKFALLVSVVVLSSLHSVRSVKLASPINSWHPFIMDHHHHTVKERVFF